MTPLIIYRASAGSGKTFTLATEYIKLVVDNPLGYRHILAVTFTNKATEEMKMRILSQLYGIWRGLPSSEGYAQRVQEELGLPAEVVAQRAGAALTLLLHNYSYFRVETIDSFFQSVLRNLARELDLTANLRIGLNDYEVEDAAVDQLIEGLTVSDVMLKWLLKYIMDSIGEDKSWNVIGRIKQFGRTIFHDDYKQYSGKLYEVMGQPGFFDDYATQLRGIARRAQEQMKGLATRFFDELEAEGFGIDDLSYGKGGVAGLFLKLKDGVFDGSIVGKRATDCVGQPELWYKKGHPRREALHHLAESRLDPLLRLAIEEQPRQWRLYQSSMLTLRHLDQLRLLESIEKRVRLLNEEANRFLLSDTQQLLHDLMDGSDSPFIYEKMGTQLEHIMIDEFQDTSTVQWKNFKVLLQETMSHEGTENLIVGDVKQSIYRWRSGDWRLLHNIAGEFGQADRMLDMRTLDTNYRSARRVVAFNNCFFAQAAETEQVVAYDDVVQQVPEGRPPGGSVSVSCLPATGYEQTTLEMLADSVGQLLDSGARPESIAILVRTNSQIPVIANFFMERMSEVRLVSDEAFRLDASPAVMTIISGLRWLVRPDDLVSKAYLARMATSGLLHEGVLDDRLPAALTTQREELLRLPLYQLAERLFSIFQLHSMQGQSAYLCAFYDQIAAYVNEQSADITAFLTEWDTTIGQKTIQSPEVNGIRLISIHKSKGLEFQHVLVPFCDWRMEHSDVLWCQPAEKPFCELPLVPIDFSRKGMAGTIYEGDYEAEHRQNMVDNLNLLYVAFTRASASLHVFCKRGAKSGRSVLIEQTIRDIADQLEGATLSGEEDEQVALVLDYGSLQASDTTARKHTEENVFLQESEPLKLAIEVFEQKVEFKQSNRSRDFATDEDDDERLEQNRYIQTGSILHELLATIRTADDVENALKRMELDGIIYDRSLTRERLEGMLRKRLAHPKVAHWFSPKWRLFNECTILTTDEQGKVVERRPDRVMTDGEETVVIDFKFGKPHSEHHDQVGQYMRLLRQMGHRKVSGYLWYVYSNEIVEVV